MDLATNTSSEAEILCNQADCELSSITRMVRAEDQFYVVNDHKTIIIFEGMSVCLHSLQRMEKSISSKFQSCDLDSWLEIF